MIGQNLCFAALSNARMWRVLSKSSAEGRSSFPMWLQTNNPEVWTACVFLPRYWQVFFAGLDAVPVSVRARSQLIFSHMKCLGDTCERSTHQRATRPICRRTSLPADSPHWDVSTYYSSHSSRRFLSGCCSGSWVGCILSHAVLTKSCEECEVPDWVIGSACDEFYRNQNRFISRLLSAKLRFKRERSLIGQ